MTSDSTETPSVHPGPPPGLLRLVKILGLVMVLLFVALIGGIIWKATHKAPPPPDTNVVTDFGIDPATIRLMTLNGDLLALTTDRELLVISVSKRKVMLRSGKP